MSSAILRAFARLIWGRTVCIAGREIAPPPQRPNFPLPCRFPLPVFNLPRMSNDLLRCVFLLGRAAEFNVPSMRASAVSKRSRPLFARSSSAIVRRSGTRGVVRERFRIRGDGRFRDGLKHMRVLSDTPAPRASVAPVSSPLTVLMYKVSGGGGSGAKIRGRMRGSGERVEKSVHSARASVPASERRVPGLRCVLR